MLSKEDKKDVKDHYGKALANKVAKATDDSARKSGSASTRHGIYKRGDRAVSDIKKGNYVKLKPTSSAKAGQGHENVTGFSPYRPGKSSPEKWTDPSKGLSKKGKEHGYSA